MPSLYDDVFDALEAHDFAIPNVNVRKPFDESPKTYPMIVVHEIVNVPKTHGTVNGEIVTSLSYQLDIQTQNCRDDEGEALTRWEAGRELATAVTTVLEGLKITRRFCRAAPIAADVLQHTWRGDCVLDASGYSYRP